MNPIQCRPKLLVVLSVAAVSTLGYGSNIAPRDSEQSDAAAPSAGRSLNVQQTRELGTLVSRLTTYCRADGQGVETSKLDALRAAVHLAAFRDRFAERTFDPSVQQTAVNETITRRVQRVKAVVQPCSSRVAAEL